MQEQAIDPTAARIVTGSEGLEEGSTDIEVDGQAVPLYWARPAGQSNPPVLLVISEIFGVHRYIADVARRYAHQGYLAVAPSLFVRQGDPGKIANITRILNEIVAITPDAQVMADLDACVAWAGRQGGDTARLGITGWCWGGRIAWLYAAHNPSVKAGVAWYGKLVGQTTPIKPRNPVHIADTLTVPVLGLYGARDDGIPMATISSMEAGLARGASGSSFVIYPHAGHAFHADYRPSYVPQAAADGFARSLEWLKSHGAA
ncbi:MAG: dienelactone hydrolase family protein [Massilia sp.]